MGVKRIVPNIGSTEPDLCREFYCGFQGLRPAMDMGWIATYVSPDNPTAQVNVLRSARSDIADGVPQPSVTVSVEVEDVGRAHREAVVRGYRIVYPLSDEPWGVRRFGVEDPNGVAINVMCHIPPPAAGRPST